MKKTTLMKLSLFVLFSLGTVANANSNLIEQNSNDIKIIKKALAKLIKDQEKLKKEYKDGGIKERRVQKSKSFYKSSNKATNFRLTLDRNLYEKKSFKSKKLSLLKKDTVFKSKDSIKDEWMFLEKEQGYIYLGKKNNRRDK